MWEFSLPPTCSRFSEFDSIARIGKGGFGRVFKAKLEDTFVAVKIVKFTKKARREVSALSRLTHPNIVRYHTSWTEETAYRDESSQSSSSSSFSGGGSVPFLYIQMELCEEDTLRDWIEKRNRYPKKYPERRQESEQTIKQVLDAVKYFHSENLIHRDLKPANIMFGDEGCVKVGDFGLVTTEEEDDDGSLQERTIQAGTCSYMSPEQVQGVYGRKVDIYALGLIYFELLWEFGTQHEKHTKWDSIRSKIFPEEFSNRFDFEHKLIEQMLSENPKRRPEAGDLLNEMNQRSATEGSTKHSEPKENRTY